MQLTANWANQERRIMRGVFQLKFIVVLFSLCVCVTAQAQPDLVLTTNSPYQFPGDGQVHFVEFTVENNGNTGAGDGISIDLSVLEPMLQYEGTVLGDPTWDCSNLMVSNGCLYQGNLAAFGGITTLEIGMIIQPGDFDLAPAITASVADVGGNETNLGDNNASVDIQYTAAGGVDLEIVKTISGGFPSTVAPGDPLNFDITINHLSGPDATNVVIMDDLIVNNLQFNQAGSSPECMDVASFIQCDLTILPTGDSVTLTIATTVGVSAQPNNYTNTATVSANEADPDNSNNSGDQAFTVAIGGAPEIEVLKSTVGNVTTVIQGQPVEYLIEVNNTGVGNAMNVDLTDTLPADVTYQSHMELGPNFTCVYNAPTLNCNAPSLPNTVAQDGVRVTVLATGAINNVVNNTATSSFADGNSLNNSATAVFQIGPPSADLDLAIIADQTTYTVGDLITLDLTVHNPFASTGAPPNTEVVTTLPTEVIYNSAQVTNVGGWLCTHDGSLTGGDVTCNSQGNPVAIGTNTFIEIIASASTAMTGLAANAVMTSDFDPNPSNDTAGAFFDIFPGDADLSIQFTSTSGTYNQGDTITYAFQVANPMISTASPSDVVADLSLPVEVSFSNVDVSGAPGWFCSHDGAPTGGVVTCDRAGAAFVSNSVHDIQVQAMAVTPATAAIAQAEIDSAADSNPGNNLVNQSDIINAAVSNFSIAKTVSGTDFAVGDSFTYVLTITNPGGSTAAPSDVMVNDQLPAAVRFDSLLVGTNMGTTVNCSHDGSNTGGLFSCDTNGTPFAIGEVVTIDVNVTAMTADSNVNNTATVETATDPDGTANNNNDSAMTVVINDPLVTTLTANKTASIAGVPVTEVAYGQNFEYVLEVTNSGANPAQNVTVTDTLPTDVSLTNLTTTGWTCVAQMTRGDMGGDINCVLDTDLAVGATAQLVAQVMATTNTTVTSITNQMQAVGSNTGGQVISDVTVNLLNPALNLNLSQNPSPVDPGGAVNFDIALQNVGTSALTSLQIDSQLPQGFTYNGFSGDPGVVCAENGGVVGCTYTPPLAISGSLNLTLNTTAIAVPQANQSYVLNTSANAAELAIPVTQNLTVAFSTSNVAVSISSIPSEVEPGTPFSHLITLTNTGNFDLVNVDAFYALSQQAQLLGVNSSDFNCTSGSALVSCVNLQPLPVGGSAQIELSLRVDNFTGLVGGNVSVEADAIRARASTSTLVTSNLANDLSLLKTAAANQVSVNEPIDYILAVRNEGSAAQTFFTVNDDLPTGMLLQAFSGDGWSCQGVTSVSCQYNGNLAAGAFTELVLRVIAPDTTGVVTNRAAVVLGGDENPVNDGSTVDVEVVDGNGGGTRRADLAVSISTNADTVVNTEQINWTIEVSNAGPDTANNVNISNMFPLGFVAEGVEVGSGVDCVLLSTSLSCDIATLGVNQTHQIIIQGGFTEGFEGMLMNLVEVTSDALDPNPSNNQSTGQVTVTPVANLVSDLALELNLTGQEIQQGSTLDMSFITRNLGPDRAVNARLTASLTGLIDQIQVLNSGQWLCQVNGSSINCSYPSDLPVGMMDNIELRVLTQRVVQQAQPITLSAMIESDGMDNQPGNNMVGFTNEVTRTPTEDEIFAAFENAVGSAASETVIQSIRNVSSYCARSYFMAIEGLCEEFIESARPENGAAIINAMEELTPNEVAGQSNSAAEIITSQFRNVDARLSQLRGGGGAGLSISGLTGRYGNESIPLGMLAYLNQSEEEQQAVSNINDFVSPWGFFVNGSISMGERDATGRELGFDFDTFGLTAGVDYRFSPTKVAGVALGYANFDSEIEDEAEMKSTGFTLTGYGSFYLTDNLYLDARLSYGNPDFEQSRRINFTLEDIAIDRVASGATDADQYSVAMSMGYHFNKNAWNITPNASIRYVNTTIDAFTETGAGDFNFAFGEQEVKSMVWSVGTSISKAISLKNGVLSPQFDINISRETENDGGLLEARFINAPEDEIFWIATDEPDRTFGSAGLGLVFIGANGKQAYINYRSIFGLDGFSRGTINIGARFEF